MIIRDLKAHFDCWLERRRIQRLQDAQDAHLREQFRKASAPIGETSRGHAPDVTPLLAQELRRKNGKAYKSL